MKDIILEARDILGVVFVLQHQVLHMGTVFTLDPPTAKSCLITSATLNQYQQPRRSL